MEIYFKVEDEKLVESLNIELLDTGFFTDVVVGNIYRYNTENTKDVSVYKEIPKNVNPTYIIYIKDDDDVVRLARILAGKELARFNTGKPEFSYIDFRLFENMYKGANYINELFDSHKYYYLEIELALSAISFGYKTEFQLNRLQALSYQLSLALLFNDNPHMKPLDPLDTTYDLRAFESMARVMMFGGKKYERNNWMKPSPNKLSSADSAYRHLKAMILGEMDDPDSGLPHIGHLMCNVMFLTYHLLN